MHSDAPLSFAEESVKSPEKDINRNPNKNGISNHQSALTTGVRITPVEPDRQEGPVTFFVANFLIQT
jgi:hypothetical protein